MAEADEEEAEGRKGRRVTVGAAIFAALVAIMVTRIFFAALGNHNDDNNDNWWQ